MSRAVAEVDLQAIKNNLTLIKSKTSAQVLAVVKADGYGHGLIPVSKAAIEAGADWLGTALLEEAIHRADRIRFEMAAASESLVRAQEVSDAAMARLH